MEDVAYEIGAILLSIRRKHGKVAPPNLLYKEYRNVLTDWSSTHNVGGRMSVGCFRIAFITKNKVYKFQYNETVYSCLSEEYDFIQRMRETSYARHFPVTQLIRYLSFPVMIQERINMSHKGIRETMHLQAKVLGRKLGIADLHHRNYGWKGRKSQEYPVYVDVDFRGESRKLRSWFVTL